MRHKLHTSSNSHNCRANVHEKDQFLQLMCIEGRRARIFLIHADPLITDGQLIRLYIKRPSQAQEVIPCRCAIVTTQVLSK